MHQHKEVADGSVRFSLDMKKIIALALMLCLLALGWPLAHAEVADHADLLITFKPAENQDGQVVLEIDITVQNGEPGQTVNRLEFRYENELIAMVDSVGARSNSFARSNPLGMSLQAMTSDLEVEVSYIDFNGDVISSPMTVSYQAAEPQISFKRTASSTSVAEGEEIRLTYLVKNEGSIPLTDLQVYDDMEGIGLVGTVDVLYPGDMREFNIDLKMTKDVKSLPRVSYKTAGSTQSAVLMLESMDLVIYNPKLNVTLKTDVTSVRAGESVTLVCNVVNEGNVGFTNVTITDETLGTIIESAKIEVGKAYSWTKLIKPVSSQNYMFTVKAVDESGKSYTTTSNIVALEVSTTTQTDMTDTLQASVTPNTTKLNQPGEVTFNVLLRNTGTQPVTELSISDQNGNVLERLNSLPTGDQIFPIAVNVLETGEYFFVVEGTLADGSKVQKITTPVSIEVGVVQDAQQPSLSAATILPTLMPTETPLSINEEVGGITPWLLMLLIVIALLIVACVVVLVWLQLRAHRRRLEEEEEEAERAQASYARPRPAPQQEIKADPYDYREEISRVATEYSRPEIPPRQPERRPQRSMPANDLYRDEDEDVQTVYKQRKPVEPKTRRND